MLIYGCRHGNYEKISFTQDIDIVSEFYIYVFKTSRIQLIEGLLLLHELYTLLIDIKTDDTVFLSKF